MTTIEIRNNESTSIKNISLFSNTWSEIIFVLVEDGNDVAFADAHNLHCIEDAEEENWIEIKNLGTVARGHRYGETLIRELQSRYGRIEAHNTLADSAAWWAKMGFEDAGENCDGEPYMIWS